MSNHKTKFEGKFIVIDGPDGCGKSTQVQMLCDWLKEQGIAFELLRDPGSTIIGEKIRQVLLNPEHNAMTTETEVLLYMAARVQLWFEKIAPALQDGKCVVLDRWLSSTCAYQGHAGGFGVERIIKIAEDCLPNPWPDLTIILDVDTKTASTRLKSTLDRMEQKGGGYHQKVRQGFLRLADQHKDCIVIDASESAEKVHSRLIDTLVEKIRKNS